MTAVESRLYSPPESAKTIDTELLRHVLRHTCVIGLGGDNTSAAIGLVKQTIARGELPDTEVMEPVFDAHELALDILQRRVKLARESTTDRRPTVVVPLPEFTIESSGAADLATALNVAVDTSPEPRPSGILGQYGLAVAAQGERVVHALQVGSGIEQLQLRCTREGSKELGTFVLNHLRDPDGSNVYEMVNAAGAKMAYTSVPLTSGGYALQRTWPDASREVLSTTQILRRLTCSGEVLDSPVGDLQIEPFSLLPVGHSLKLAKNLPREPLTAHHTRLVLAY